MFIAKMTMRVRESALNEGDIVSLKGPAIIVTDSNATARVDTESLISTGGLVEADKLL